MYYYIFDPPEGAKEYERTAQIKQLLSELGIAGEMTAPQPGRSPEDLVNLAVAKRYSTVVAVGGMDLVNRVARAVLAYDIVFGIIPTTEHADIEYLIGVSDWKSAAEQLKRRRWQSVRLGLMNDSVCFLTPATISLPGNTAFDIETDEFAVAGKGGSIVITPVRQNTDDEAGLTVDILPGEASKGGFLKSLFGGGKSNAPRESRFTVPSLTLTTEGALPVTVAGTELIETPIRCTTQDKSIRLIVAKGTSA